MVYSLSKGETHMEKRIKDILDNELIENLDSLVEKEGSTTVEILMHLTELDRRKLFVAFGYSSLFSYLTLRLKYSEGAAMRRIKASRCISEYPEVLELLKRREVNLTTICIFCSILSKENCRELLALVINKSQAEVERLVSQYRPRGEVRDQTCGNASRKASIHKARRKTEAKTRAGERF